MKKNWKSLILAGILSLSVFIPTFAGSWQLDAKGYWYQNDDGSYPSGGWKWIDGNNDGIAENYYFDNEGYLLVNTTTPDGNAVNANGAWTLNGIVQTQDVTLASAQTPSQSAGTAAPQTSSTSSPAVPQNNIASTEQATQPQTNTVWISATEKKYHRINNCGNMNPNRARSMPLEQAIQEGYGACSKCY
ncbi:MAG: hypothetical protein HFG49_14640 [Lachnospiraceae bacterium]|nr:hypothetical protein [Lachnospiraceae bacterium]